MHITNGIAFLQALDSRPDATFNIEHYTDVPKGQSKPSPDPLKKRYANLTVQQVQELLPQLEQINARGAGIFVAVNQCQGQRSKGRVTRIRGAHADMDNVTQAQLDAVCAALHPSIVVQSSSATRWQLYWLLAEGETLDVQTVEGINRALVRFGADPAAVDASRLLRLPGLRHMKYRDSVQTPLVPFVSHPYRYTRSELLSAFPPEVLGKVTSGHDIQVNLQPAVLTIPDPVASQIATTMERQHPELWQGRWQDAKSKTSGIPFDSQSQADMALASHIARECRRSGVGDNELGDITLKVFSMSGLAVREKWYSRPEYRLSTISKAVHSCTQASPAPTLALPLGSYGDIRNAQAFAHKWHGKLIYIPTRDAWLRWHQGRWQLCEKEEQVACAKELCAEMLSQSTALFKNDQEKGKKLVQDAMASHNLPKIKAMLQLAVSEPGMAVTERELDADPMQLGVQNGVVDLKNGHLLVNHPEMMVTRFCSADFVEDAQCPKWLQFLQDIFQGDQETIESVQRLLGYTLTGLNTEEILVICFGFGSNGKSVFNNVVQKIKSGYARTAPASLLTVRRADDTGPRNDIAALAGARYVSVNELQAGDKLDEQVVKLLAGREPISARFLNREFFEFNPTFTAWLRTNHKPIITGSDDGIWRRLVLIPFRRKFEDHEKNPCLEEELLAERDGIMQWMLKGTRLYLKDGLKLSATIKAEHASYRKASDLIGEFLDEKTVAGPNCKVEQGQLYTSWNLWCANSGLRPGAKKTFTQRLAERGYGEIKSNGNRFYSGLTLAVSGLFSQGR